jgi:hypothetical protein
MTTTEKKLNATASFIIKYALCIFFGIATTLVNVIIQTTTVSTNPALAVDGILDVSPLQKKNSTSATDSILDISPLQKVTTQVNPRDIPSGVALSKMTPQDDQEFIKPKIPPAQLIAQTDSSGVVGDTLGELNKLRQQLLIEPIVIEGKAKASPASSAGTPTGYGASWRQAYVGVGGYLPFDGGNVDGSASVGFGLGDAVKSVGVELGVNVTSLGGQDLDFGQSGAVGLKVHKYFADGTAVAVGWSNPIKWGEVSNTKETFYGVVTRAFDLQPKNPNNRMPLTVSLGLGTGSFRSQGAIAAGDNSINFFGSLGLRIAPQVSLVTSWTGNSLNVGGSFAPLPNTPLVINAIFTDITDTFDNATGLSISAGYVFQF